tara:strand:- start:930 stop:3374 length:2445 start_codon:yes stop_codon:yes gene_type:complete
MLGEEATLQDAILDKQISRLDKAQDFLVLMEKEGVQGDAINKKLKENEEIQKSLNMEAKRRGIDQDELLKQLAEEGDLYKTINKLNLQRRATLKDIKQFQKDIAAKGESFAKSMGLAGKAADTTLGGVLKMAHQMKQAALEGKSMGEMLNVAVGNSFNMTNILGSALDIIGKFVVGTDNAAKNFQKMTGFSGDFTTQIQGVSSNLVKTGITAEDVGKNYGALAQSFSGFNKNAESLNQELVTNISLLEKVGVDAASSGKNLDFFTRSLGMSAPEANRLNMEIATMGDGMGVTASKMASDFKTVSGALSVYGDRMTGVFQRLAATAKATGIEVSSLMALGQKFDTFSDAAKNTASLNAVLGTNISAMEMMNMNEEERIQLLRQQIKLSVGDMNNLDKYTQQYIAQTLGMKDVAEARALINMSESEYLSNIGAQKESAKTQKEMADQLEKLVPELEKLKLEFLAAVLAAEPLITIMTKLLKFVGENAKLIVGLTMAYVTYNSIQKIATMWTHLSTIAQIASKVATFGMTAAKAAEIMVTNGTITAKAAELAINSPLIASTWALVAAKWALVGAVVFVIAIFAYLILTLTQSNSPPMWQIFGVIAVGVLLLAAALYFIQGPAQLTLLLLVGLAAAMGLMFYGMAAVISGLTSLITLMVENLAVLPLIGMAFYMFAGGLMAMGAAGVYAAIGLGVSMAALVAIMAVMAFGGMNFGDITAAGEGIGQMGIGVEKLASGLGKIKSMAAQISNMGDQGFLAVRSDGTATSMVMGSDDVMKNFIDGKMTIDVKIPEIKMPEITLNVTVNGGDVDVVKKIARA